MVGFGDDAILRLVQEQGAELAALRREVARLRSQGTTAPTGSATPTHGNEAHSPAMALATHTHSGYAASIHSHTESDISDLDHDAVKLQGRAVGTAAPSVNDVLAWDGAQWAPAAGAGVLGTRWEPLTNGDEGAPALVFAGGDVIMVEVAI